MSQEKGEHLTFQFFHLVVDFGTVALPPEPELFILVKDKPTIFYSDLFSYRRLSPRCKDYNVQSFTEQMIEETHADLWSTGRHQARVSGRRDQDGAARYHLQHRGEEDRSQV
jgi:hypothetical protein